MGGKVTKLATIPFSVPRHGAYRKSEGGGVVKPTAKVVEQRTTIT
jgi:hypothetical protein